MKHIVYLTINLTNYKIYIGVHQTSIDGFDGYIGCGVGGRNGKALLHPKTPFQHAVKKHGYKNFKRITLAAFDTEEEAYKLEEQLVTVEFINRPDTYNAATGGRYRMTVANCQPVSMYSLEGQFIKTFISLAEAARFLKHVKTNAIALACKDPNRTAGGYRWSFTANLTLAPMLDKGGRKKEIEMLDSAGNIVKVYESVSAAQRDGYKSVVHVLKGKQSTSKGMSFRYKN